ncbi:YueI family protein [Heyndrickxia acidicola]|uniref:YueI family protein n=1 Tax=Heyndrickxia acidicola TaxID=209389 RepID=A0ABU6MKM9_9BACI|nr:YueI family protein [Heyndrickxia acidicola]MED1205242.1 YueI family protein [Heyndrickxia acidicola]
MAQKPDIEDYLQKGMYGTKETKPEERKKFLGTLRERIVIALLKNQIYENGTYPEIEENMKKHKQATLYLNGDVNYNYLSKYIAIAKKHSIPFSIVSKHTGDTNIGLVLAYNYAIDQEEIYLTKKNQAASTAPIKKGGVLSSLKKMIKKPKKTT